jgi:hypothetical protein
LTVDSGKSLFFLLLSMWLFLRKGSSSREDVDFFFYIFDDQKFVSLFR